MRYTYKEPAASVPPPKELALQVPANTDTLQDLLQRREEARKNRLLFHLTESDCDRICTNSTEKRYTPGQVIVNEGEVISALYRIKSGKVSLMKGEVKLCDLPQGHFLGEGLFIRGNAQDVYRASLVANGPLVLSQVNLPFVRHLIDMDKVLAFKIYRHIACKLSALLFSMVGKVSSDSALQSDTSSISSDSDISSPPLSSSSTSSSTSSISSSSISSSSLSPTGVRSPTMTDDMLNPPERRVKKKKTLKPNSRKDVAFKTYQLQEAHPGAQAILFSKKLVITGGCKLALRRKIKYNKILDMAKTGKSSVTIIYGVQARTIFFKDEEELNEFYRLVQSLILTGVGSTAHLPSVPPLSQSGALLPNPLARSASLDPAQAAADKLAMSQLAVRQDLVKGDVVVAEGDLYSRIYTVASGQLSMKFNDRTLVTIGEGEVFGVVTLFYMRPCNITIEVASDTATLLIIPSYKIQELISSNFPLAARLHKKAAQLVFSQIERILQGPGQGYSLAGLLI